MLLVCGSLKLSPLTIAHGKRVAVQDSTALLCFQCHALLNSPITSCTGLEGLVRMRRVRSSCLLLRRGIAASRVLLIPGLWLLQDRLLLGRLLNVDVVLLILQSLGFAISLRAILIEHQRVSDLKARAYPQYEPELRMPGKGQRCTEVFSIVTNQILHDGRQHDLLTYRHRQTAHACITPGK